MGRRIHRDHQDVGDDGTLYVCLPEGLGEALDRRRGDVPRTEFVRRLMEAELGFQERRRWRAQILKGLERLPPPPGPPGLPRSWQRILELRAQGLGLRTIAGTLNREGLGREEGTRRDCLGKWNNGSVQLVLRRLGWWR